MAQEWIETLAEEIKQKNREAALDFGRTQHYAGIISAHGKEFFVAVVSCLRENVDALRSRLQGDPTSADTRCETVKPDELKIERARFPWVDARVIHRDDTIALDYAKGLGTMGDPAMDRKTRIFGFHVAADDTLYVEDAFVEPPDQYRQPADLARHITEILFGVESSTTAK